MTNQDNKNVFGTLWMAATTLGDTKDIPLRSLELMRSCPFLVFEEDKKARQFLKAAQVQRQWMRYTEQREQFTLEELEKELRAGNDALYMSDQGTPGLADPGRDLVSVAFRIGAKVRAVPGPSSLTAAISVCPIDCRRFQFAGFPPRDEAEREAFMREQFDHPWPVVLFDTPYRLRSFFETLCRILDGTDRKIFVALDISGPEEDFWYGPSHEILKKISLLNDKLNYVVIVEGTGFQKPRQSRNKSPKIQPQNNQNRFKTRQMAKQTKSRRWTPGDRR